MVQFNEEAGSPTWAGAPTSFSAKRQGFINWADIPAFFAQVFPPPVSNSSEVENIYGAFMPGSTVLRATGVSIVPHGKRITGPDTIPDFNTIIGYELAYVEVDYSAIPFPPDDQTDEQGQDPVSLLTHNWSAGGEFLTLPGQGLQWESDGELLSDGETEAEAAKVIPTIEHSITWPMIPYPPFEAIREQLGKVNEEEVEFATGKIAPETLLFAGASLSREVTTAGSRPWNLTYNLSERRIALADGEVGGWNHVYRPDAGKFERVVIVGGEEGESLYLTANPEELFQQEFV